MYRITGYLCDTNINVLGLEGCMQILFMHFGEKLQHSLRTCIYYANVTIRPAII